MAKRLKGAKGTRTVLRKPLPGQRYELFRVLVVDDVPLIEIAAMPAEDPAAIGLILSDLTKHFAILYSNEVMCTAEEAQNRIIEAFTADILAGPPAEGEFRQMETDDERQIKGN